MKNRITDWRPGDVVRALVDIHDGSKPFLPLQEGSLVKLWNLERVQDGLEIWTAWQGWRLYGLCHIQVEQCCGPLRRM